MKRILVCAIIVAVSICFTACANILTIWRTTPMPASTLPVPTSTGGFDVEKASGVAIHLDAQQRLVFVKPGGRYCAEPSPDALSAYASSLGLGVSAPSQGAASVANALQSSAGSIGLRTQSITLMREALYRMCEAYENGVIGPIQVSMLLGRSQDLTAVVLAVEQLTGAVAANQVTLGGTAGAGSSASLLSEQKLLEAAKKDEDEKKANLDAANKELEDAKKPISDKKAEVKTAEDAYKKAIAPDSKVEKPEQDKLKADFETKSDNLKQLESKVTAAEGKVNTNQQLYDSSKKIREAIEKNKDSALTSAAANTSGVGNFSNTLVQRKELSPEATNSIAESVRGMIESVLKKDYSRDSCMAFLTAPKNISLTTMEPGQFKIIQDVCVDLIKATVTEETNRILSSETGTFGRDKNSDLIENATQKNNELKIEIKEWLSKKHPGTNYSSFLYWKECSQLRETVINQFKIK
jgi:hypothetical protein